jgi:hypothetical protein
MIIRFMIWMAGMIVGFPTYAAQMCEQGTTLPEDSRDGAGNCSSKRMVVIGSTILDHRVSSPVI